MIHWLGRVLAVAAFLLLAVPAWSAVESSEPASESLETQLSTAGALFGAGRYEEALDLLQPLALEQPDNTDILFLLGLVATEASQRSGASEAVREALLELGISSFHTILVEEPGLVRVRLELALAFFLKGEDGLAREHFELVLAGDVPDAVRTNVNEFLAQIRARRRWNMHFGFALQPDDNIGGASNERIIYISGLPFERDVDERTTSGIGLSVWTGGEYQYPFEGRPVRLRMGSNLSRKEYRGGEFDEMTLSAHAGPQWLVDQNTDLSLLADVSRRWVEDRINNDEWGARVELGRRLSPTVTADARVSAKSRHYRERKHLDGWSYNLSLGGAWIPLPILRANASIGYAKEDTESDKWRNTSRSIGAGVQVALPYGFTVGGNARREWKGYGGGWGVFTPGGGPREDRTRTVSVSVFNRGLTLLGFSPQLILSNDVRKSNAQLHGYRRNRGELLFVRQF